MAAAGGLAFWLDYVESRGGLWESSGDTALVMIPPQLQRTLELPEEFAVTEHPDVAREDGIALLGAGHPLLTAAAEDVLSADDAGIRTVAAPASQPPDGHRLLARARDQFPVGHGRIDASGPVERGIRQVLRVGALVTYSASADDRFCERAECWVDVVSRHELPGHAAARLRRAAASGSAAARKPDLSAVPPALARAHRLLEASAAGRSRELAGGSARDAAQAELARAEKYYAEALASLTRRQATAAADRRALLAARMDSVRSERQRRLAEIKEKYTPQHQIRPYRLHLLRVPALTLPVDVLRGARRFPLMLAWLLPAGAFAPVRCPACGADAAHSPLVAAKTHLGCASCLPGAEEVPAGPAVPARPAGPAGPAVQPSRPAGNESTSTASGPADGGSGHPAGGRPRDRTQRPAHRAVASPPARLGVKPRPLSPQALHKAGEKLAMEFWSITGQGNLRALRRLCEADSPAAAAIRLYGAAGPAAAVGLAGDEHPESLTFATAAPGDGEMAGTFGQLHTDRGQHSYLLRWRTGTRLIREILPFGTGVSARLPSPGWSFGPAAARMFEPQPQPQADLDPVAIRLWRKVVPEHGRPLAWRCLAAWWRISGDPQLLAGHQPSVLAAGLHRMVGYRAGQAGVTHDAIAGLHRVTAADTRAITPLLQARLKLSSEQPW